MGAREMVDCLSVYKLRVRVPPSHTAFIGAELFFSFVWGVYQALSALRAFCFVRDVRIPSAIVLYGVR